MQGTGAFEGAALTLGAGSTIGRGKSFATFGMPAQARRADPVASMTIGRQMSVLHDGSMVIHSNTIGRGAGAGGAGGGASALGSLFLPGGSSFAVRPGAPGTLGTASATGSGLTAGRAKAPSLLAGIDEVGSPPPGGLAESKMVAPRPSGQGRGPDAGSRSLAGGYKTMPDFGRLQPGQRVSAPGTGTGEGVTAAHPEGRSVLDSDQGADSAQMLLEDDLGAGAPASGTIRTAPADTQAPQQQRGQPQGHRPADGHTRSPTAGMGTVASVASSQHGEAPIMMMPQPDLQTPHGGILMLPKAESAPVVAPPSPLSETAAASPAALTDGRAAAPGGNEGIARPEAVLPASTASVGALQSAEAPWPQAAVAEHPHSRPATMPDVLPPPPGTGHVHIVPHEREVRAVGSTAAVGTGADTMLFPPPTNLSEGGRSASLSDASTQAAAAAAAADVHDTASAGPDLPRLHAHRPAGTLLSQGGPTFAPLDPPPTLTPRMQTLVPQTPTPGQAAPAVPPSGGAGLGFGMASGTQQPPQANAAGVPGSGSGSASGSGTAGVGATGSSSTAQPGATAGGIGSGSGSGGPGSGGGPGGGPGGGGGGKRPPRPPPPGDAPADDTGIAQQGSYRSFNSFQGMTQASWARSNAFTRLVTIAAICNRARFAEDTGADTVKLPTVAGPAEDEGGVFTKRLKDKEKAKAKKAGGTGDAAAGGRFSGVETRKILGDASEAALLTWVDRLIPIFEFKLAVSCHHYDRTSRGGQCQ